MNPLGGLISEVRPRVSNAEKIAVLRANGIGDYLFALPALESLRDAYPDAEIVYLGAPWHREVLSSRPGPVDRFEVVPPTPGIRELLASESGRDIGEWKDDFFSAMRDEHFDLAFQMHGGGANSNPFLLSLGARVSVGLRSDHAVGLDLCLPFYYYQHEVVRFLELVALAGAPPVTMTPHWNVTDQDRAALRHELGHRPRLEAVLNPGAGDGRRRWPPEKFAAVGDALVRAGASAAISGSSDDGPLADAVASAMAEPSLDLAGRLGLPELAALFEEADVVVSNDSGPLHLARAVGTRTAAVYWCGNLINAGPLGNSRHRVALSWRVHCPACGADCTAEAACAHQVSFVADVPVTEVAAGALSLWQEAAASPLRSQLAQGRQQP